MSHREEPREIPIKGEYDVVVVGGGPTGVSAAFAAARLGMKTLIVEQFNCLGGVATAGGHGHICLYSVWGEPVRIVGGVTYEVAKRTADAGYGIVDNSHTDFEVEGMKLVLEEMAEECGVEILYHTFFCESIVEDNTVTGVVIQNKGGRQAVMAKRVIDATGDGDVAATAGCGFDVGDEETGNCQPVTLMFTIGGVDWERVCTFRNEEFPKKYPDGNIYQLDKLWAEAQENGDMRPFQHVVMGWWHTPTRPDQVGVNFTHVNLVDATRAEDLTSSTIEARKQAYETIEVYRKYVPGMENCYMISTPNTIGLRESRRIRGEVQLTKEDLLAMRDWEDSIGYGSFFIDIHNCDGPGMDKKTIRPEKGFKYQMPYRMLVPETVDNLLVAGRCASCTHEALGSLRVMPQCGVMGEAAGVAAVISIQSGVSPREVDVKALQEKLQQTGGIVCDEDIRRYNA